MTTEVLCIIPARGGSKGVPRKNVRPLGGKPLLVHSIEHAKASPSVTRVVVSTDDAEIAAVARAAGAEVVERPAAISGDTASSESALLHVLDALRANEGYEPELVVFLQATSPLRRPDDVERAVATLRREEADSLFSACPVHGFVWRVEGGRPRSFTYDHTRRPRRQDAPEDLVENGSIYVFRPRILRDHGNRLGGRIAVFRMDPADSFQIDEPADFDLLESLLSARARAASPPDLAAIRLLVLDFDGVLTDNRVHVDQDGRESVSAWRSDGIGISGLAAAGVEVFVLSKETNPVVAARARKLRVPFLQGCDDKLVALQQIAKERGLSPREVAYVGNDVNDLECLAWAGVPIAVADAYPEARAVARMITTRPGGRGAVREVCDLLLRSKRAAPPDR